MEIQNCQKCGKEISRILIASQSDPGSTAWVRQGYCSHNCYLNDENADSQIQDSVPQIKTQDAQRIVREQVESRTAAGDSPNVDAGKSGGGLLVAGWIFAFMGGLVGLIIGIILRNKKFHLEDGRMAGYKYNKDSRDQGRAIIILSIVMSGVWLIVRYIRIMSYY